MLRVAAAVARPVTLHFVRPVVTARGEFATRSSVILALRDADGATGYGEAAPWPGFATETAEVALDLLQRVAQQLAGATLAPEAWPDAVAELLREAPAARAALSGALWDLAARRAGRPLAAEFAAGLGPFGGAVPAEVAVSALLLERTPAALGEEARRVREAGYRAAKLKLGAARLDDDVARCAAARAGLGAGVALRGDANGAWDEAGARTALAALAPYGLAYVEQPLPAGDVAGMARLRGSAPVRIAADESVTSAAGARRLLAAGAADVLVLKPGILGGAAAALAIAAEARRAGCEAVFTHAFESAIGARHALACAAAWADPAAAHGLATAGLFADDLAPVPEACRGMLAVGRDPGIGPVP